ncbi:hypothetical protein F511_40021 [Dorcoceras hygrometricum]|uniref:Uncharacterized protein n=1 Tax=Dorcoceras hygrometricum TaxID=472368 RepID=A0A2Z7DC38_9LAMI|nr:hypothetical protein F511_40021 [Dorcoceras hygrometricum]
MKTSNKKRFSRKHDRKVLVAEESTKSWADSDLDSSSRSSSSSESEQEEVHCFMADQTDEDEGLTDLSEVPKDLLSNAQHLFSASEKEVSISCLKKEVKMPFRLLSDILAKSLFVKAGSFDAVTRDRFLLMTAITFDVKVNWGNLLFGVLKEMVTPDSRQAKGYAIQICVLLKNLPGLELGESKAFPAPRILNENTVHRIVSVNENVGVEEVGDSSRAKTTPVKRTVSKKRPASVDADVAPVIKKKRTTKIKPVAAKKLVLEEPIAVVPSTEEQIPVAGVATEEHIPVKEIAIEDADATIRQFIRGGDAKKGKSGSSSRPPPVRVERRPLPTPQSPRDVAGGSSAVRIPTFPRTTGTFEERVEQARRHLLESGLVISVEEAAERIRQADFQESDRFQRERERARREKRSSSSRRRRGF